MFRGPSIAQWFTDNLLLLLGLAAAGGVLVKVKGGQTGRAVSVAVGAAVLVVAIPHVAGISGWFFAQLIG